MKHKFIQPFAMEVTDDHLEHFNKEVLPKLLEMGYNEDDMERSNSFGVYHFILSNWKRNHHKLSFGVKRHYEENLRILLPPNHFDLLLAIAAMTDKEDGIKGEWWKCTSNKFPSFTKNKLYQQKTEGKTEGKYGHIYLIVKVDDKGSNTNGLNYSNFEKATLPEILDHFGYYLDGQEVKEKESKVDENDPFGNKLRQKLCQHDSVRKLGLHTNWECADCGKQMEENPHFKHTKLTELSIKEAKSELKKVKEKLRLKKAELRKAEHEKAKLKKKVNKLSKKQEPKQEDSDEIKLWDWVELLEGCGDFIKGQKLRVAINDGSSRHPYLVVSRTYFAWVSKDQIKKVKTKQKQRYGKL